VVSNSTVKERVLYLFSDLLLIAKESASVQSANNPTNTQIRTIVDLSQMQLVEDRHLDPVIERPKRDPVIRKAINLFDRLNARHAIEYLVEKQFVSATAQSVAYFLYHTPGLNPRQLGRFLGVEDNREILLAYLNYYEFSGLRLDWALRLFFQLFRLPGDPDAIDGILQAFADRFTACNPSVCADSYFVLKLVLAILMLNAQWHGREGQAITAIDTTEPFRMTSEQFVAGLLQSVDEPVAGDLLSEEYLSAVYVGIQSDRLSVAMTFEEEEDKMRIQFSPLPYRLTVDEPSQSITVRLPQPDPGLRIRIFSHGSLECNVQDLAFTDSSEQKFMLTGTKIGRQSISFVKYGPSAGRYANSSLPFAGQAIIVGPPFMRHVFQLRTIHRDPETRRKITYLFSVANDKQQENWSMQIRTVLQMLSGNTLIDYGLPMDNEQALKLLQFFDCDSSSCEGVKFVPTDARERLEFSKQ
jgi:hypothetical protein